MGVKDYQICVAGGHRSLRSSLHSGHIGSAAGSSRWAYALRSGVCPARRRAGRTASALLEVAMQSAFQEICAGLVPMSPVRRSRREAAAGDGPPFGEKTAGVVLRPGRSGGRAFGGLALSVALVPSGRRLLGSPRRACNLDPVC